MTRKNLKASLVTVQMEAILESISDGVFTVDSQWRITYFNRAAEVITGILRKEAIGRQCCEVFRSNRCETDCALRKTLQSGKPIIGQSGYIINAEGMHIPISVSTAVLRDSDGTIIGGAETFRDLSEIESLRKELEGRHILGDLVSRSPLMHNIFSILPSIASSTSSVLILGETGTGKELIARTIHSLSDRSQKPFIALNCGALPDTLLESELFGYKAGAFTGAAKDKPGRFALAHSGTLFLDEIGEISQALQVRLLRVLQEHVFEPLGSTRSEPTNVRIIAATNKDIRALMQSGVFRDDLYYRIAVIRIELPPLRDRKEDIPLLITTFIDHFNKLQHRSVPGISPDALSLLMAYDWPGNIRELENIIERAFILCRNELITVKELPEELLTVSSHIKTATDFHKSRSLTEIEAITNALKKHSYNRLAAAKALGIHKTTLFRKIKHYNISLPEIDGRTK